MRIVATHSQFSGLEFLLVHKPDLWEKLQQTITGIDTTDDMQIERSLRNVIAKEDRIDLTVQMSDDSNSLDALARQQLRYARYEIDVGIEIFEGELYNVIRNGRGVPAVPLVMIGVAP